MNEVGPGRLVLWFVLAWVAGGLVFLVTTIAVGGLMRGLDPTGALLGVVSGVGALVAVALGSAVGVVLLPRALVGQGIAMWLMAGVPGPMLLVIVNVASSQVVVERIYEDAAERPFLATTGGMLVTLALAGLGAVLGAIAAGLARRRRTGSTVEA